MNASTRLQLVALLPLSAAAMTWAAHMKLQPMSLAIAGVTGLALVLFAWRTNRTWQDNRTPSAQREATLAQTRTHIQPVVGAAADNAALLGAVYAWGAMSMLAVYLLSGLKWQHGWQYGTGMALIAAGLWFYRRRLLVPNAALAERKMLDTVALLSLLHGLGALAGLAFLVLSGKLATPKPDWAANHIFLVGALTIAAIAPMSLATHRRLRQR